MSSSTISRGRTSGCSRGTCSHPTSSGPGSTTSGRTRSMRCGCARTPGSSPSTSTYREPCGRSIRVPVRVPWRLHGRSAEVVLQSYDVVLAEVAASLDLDEDEPLPSRIFDAVGRADGHVHNLSRMDAGLPPVESDLPRPAHHHP